MLHNVRQRVAMHGIFAVHPPEQKALRAGRPSLGADNHPVALLSG
jgi:hypothetical protein